jgi:hypothetical protein
MVKDHEKDSLMDADNKKKKKNLDDGLWNGSWTSLG